jgi:hypothetical protein
MIEYRLEFLSLRYLLEPLKFPDEFYYQNEH